MNTAILGTYGLVLDTIAPVIKIAKPIEGKWISDQKKIDFTIGDSLSGIKSVRKIKSSSMPSLAAIP